MVDKSIQYKSILHSTCMIKEKKTCVHKLKIHLERFNSTGDIVVVMDRIDTNECPFILTQMFIYISTASN